MNPSKSSIPTSSENTDLSSTKIDQSEPETGGEGKWRRWKFQYFTESLSMCVFKVKGTKDQKPLFEFCKYILCDHQNKDLVICFIDAKPQSWFHQFYYLNRDTLKELSDTNKSNVTQVLKELGPDYQILYNERSDGNQEESDTRNLQSPSSTPQKRQLRQKETQKTEGSKGDIVLETPKEVSSIQEAEEGSQGKMTRKKIQKSKEKEAPFLETPKIEPTEWLDQIKGGVKLRDIGKWIADKDDKKLAFLYLENFDFLKAEEVKLEKRSQKETPDEEKKVQKYLKTEKGETKVFLKREGIKRERRGLTEKKHEEEEEGIKNKVNEERPKAQSESERDLLENFCAYYRHQEFFDKKVRPLPLFKKELEAFERTLSPEQKKEVEQAMDNGFNPVYYIYKWKTKEKNLKDIRIARDRKDVKNRHVLGMVYDYIANHLQK